MQIIFSMKISQPTVRGRGNEASDFRFRVWTQLHAHPAGSMGFIIKVKRMAIKLT